MIEKSCSGRTRIGREAARRISGANQRQSRGFYFLPGFKNAERLNSNLNVGGRNDSSRYLSIIPGLDFENAEQPNSNPNFRCGSKRNRSGELNIESRSNTKSESGVEFLSGLYERGTADQQATSREQK
jgi:hypothetical protein